MKVKICEENAAAVDKLPPKMKDGSGIGVHYIDAYIKPMNVTLDDGTKVTCKRKGLKINLGVGEKNGGGLMRRLDVGKEPAVMLKAALEEAAKEAEVQLTVEDGAIYLEQ